ncbi:hypothetical protein [Chitinophaga rupis]|nr:hypothetical protein [Chitinophaga rupis]
MKTSVLSLTGMLVFITACQKTEQVKLTSIQKTSNLLVHQETTLDSTSRIFAVDPTTPFPISEETAAQTIEHSQDGTVTNYKITAHFSQMESKALPSFYTVEFGFGGTVRGVWSSTLEYTGWDQFTTWTYAQTQGTVSTDEIVTTIGTATETISGGGVTGVTKYRAEVKSSPAGANIFLSKITFSRY